MQARYAAYEKKRNGAEKMKKDREVTIVCSRCRKEVHDISGVVFEGDAPVCLSCHGKPFTTERAKSFIDNNQATLEGWDP